MEKQKTQKSQFNIKGKVQNWRTDSAQLQNLLWGHSNQNIVVFGKRIEKEISEPRNRPTSFN